MPNNSTCELCKKDIDTPDFGDGVLDYSDVYEYRGFSFHGDCFDEGVEKVDYKRSEVVKTVDASVRSQADGEWQNGGYKYMKTDVSGRPIPSKVTEPQILKDYENGKL